MCRLLRKCTASASEQLIAALEPGIMWTGVMKVLLSNLSPKMLSWLYLRGAHQHLLFCLSSEQQPPLDPLERSAQRCEPRATFAVAILAAHSNLCCGRPWFPTSLLIQSAMPIQPLPCPPVVTQLQVSPDLMLFL